MAEALVMTRDSRDTPERNAKSRNRLDLAKRATDYIDRHPGEIVNLERLAKALAVSPWHLQRTFKDVVGVSPKDYADARRSHLFRDELKRGTPIAAATYEAGYGSSSRVYERAERLLGMTPASYAKGGRGALIDYTIVDSPLGRLLVAATARGVCFVALGSDDVSLARTLEAEFPAATGTSRNDDALAPAVESLIDYLEGKGPHIDLPLDVRATAFQRHVWQELLAIPAGETRTYAEIARSLGVPKGQRAVGRACATNPVSLLIPCHRALRSDGGLGGYRWGLGRKEALLTLEKMVGERGDR
jgi:AraC family transcriptional regulator of adaptative response/methylated-DNA-[protein]-cysteine methyltransferase